MQAYIVSAQLETVTFIVHPTLHFTKTGCGTDCSFVIFCFLPTVSLYGECRWYTLFIVEAHHTKFIKIISSDDRKTVFGCTRASDPVLQCANVLHIHIFKERFRGEKKIGYIKCILPCLISSHTHWCFNKFPWSMSLCM